MSTLNKRISAKYKKEVQDVIAYLDNPRARKRAYVSLLALNALTEYLESRKVSIDTANNCCNNPLILNEFDIADIKLENNVRIDIRAVVNDVYPQMWIPKDHRAYELSPDIYVGVKADVKLTKVEFMGFIAADEIKICTGNKNYFFVDSTELRPMSDLLGAIKTITPKQRIHLSLDHSNAKALFLSYIENTISGFNKEFLIRHLATCESCRMEFYNLYNLEKNLSQVDTEKLSHYFSLQDYDNTLPVHNIYSKSEVNAEKLGLISFITGIFKKKPENLHYVGLSSLQDLGNDTPENIPEKEIPDHEIIEVPGFEDALDILYEPNEDSSKIDNNEAIEELEKEKSQEENIVEHNCIVESAPEIAEQENEEIEFEQLSIISVSMNEIACQDSQNYEILKKYPVKYLRHVKNINKLNLIKIEKKQNCAEADNSSSDNMISHITSAFEGNYQETEYLLAETNKRIFKNLIDELNGFDREIKSFSSQELSKLDMFGSDFQVIAPDQISEEDAEAEVSVEDILANLDEIEVIDNIEVINTLFKANRPQNDIRNLELEKVNRKSHLIKVASVLAAAGVLTCTGLILNNHLNKPSDIMTTSSRQDQPGQLAYTQNNANPSPAEAGNPSATDSSKPESYNIKKSRNLNEVLATAFVAQNSGINITNVSWEVGVSFANDPVIRNYLMVTGQIIKSALSKELLSATERAANDRIKIDLILDLKGNIQDSKVSMTSGSKQIDEIVLQTLKETLNYTKLPAIQTNKKNISAGIIINL